MNVLTEKRIVTAVRWLGRLLSVLLLGLVIVLAIGEGKPEHMREMAMAIAFWTMLEGLVLAWKWEGLGSLLILGGFIAFAAGGIRPNLAFGTFLITGLLFLFCWWRTRTSQRNANRTGS